MPQRYRVSGASKVFGVAPGGTFERELDPVQEERLLKGGAITKVRRQTSAKTKGPKGSASKE